MTFEEMLTILGPGLTTAGAGLLAFDVLRAPVRLARQQRRTATLAAAERRHDANVLKFDEKSGATTGEHEAGLARIDATHDAVVGRVKTAYTDAATREGDRAFRLAIWGLLLVALGGTAETIAAILVATH